MNSLPASPSTPAVWRWYIIYCAVMALLYVMAIGIGIFMLVADFDLTGTDALILQIQGGLFVGLGIILFLMFAAGPLVPKKTWGWIYGMVLIGISFTSMCCLPFGIPLLIFWIKPETQRFFGRE